MDPNSAQAVAAFLQRLRGKAPLGGVAEAAGLSRFSVSRWISGAAEPKLPDFLRLVDASSRRILDLLAAFEDPAKLPSVRVEWEQRVLAERTTYELPWSNAVLRALELVGAPLNPSEQEQWIATRLGIEVDEVKRALSVLVATSQVQRTKRGYRTRHVINMDTSRDPERALQLKRAWADAAVARMTGKAPGRYGYSLFAVSKADLVRLNELHLQYVRAMQDVIARSTPNECVGLYCSQLLDLAGEVRFDGTTPEADTKRRSQE